MDKKSKSNPKEQKQKSDETIENVENVETNEAVETVENTEVVDTQKELKESQDKYLRLLAEFDNYKKRTVKEKTAIYDDSVAETVKKIMPVYDNLTRAIETENSDLETLKKGLDMISKQFSDALTSIGVEEISTEMFNPQLHNAIMHIEDEQKGEGEIVEVLQKGYKIRDKVIRHSMVKVAN